MPSGDHRHQEPAGFLTNELLRLHKRLNLQGIFAAPSSTYHWVSCVDLRAVPPWIFNRLHPLRDNRR